MLSVAHRVGGGIAVLLNDSALEGVEWSAAPPAALYPQERPGTHCTGGWVGPKGRSGRAENLVPTGIRSRNVQPVA